MSREPTPKDRRLDGGGDEALEALMEALALPAHRAAQIEAAALAALERPRQGSLVAEWIGLLRLRPISTAALALAGAAVLLVTGPLGLALASLF